MHKKAAETNSRSGGGRQCVILWNELNELYGVSAATKRLPSGISTGSINRNQQPIDENEGGDTEETTQAAQFFFYRDRARIFNVFAYILETNKDFYSKLYKHI